MKQDSAKQREKTYKALLQIAKEQNNKQDILYYEKMLKCVQISKVIEKDFV